MHEDFIVCCGYCSGTTISECYDITGKPSCLMPSKDDALKKIIDEWNSKN
jgi:hypothetical protein